MPREDAVLTVTTEDVRQYWDAHPLCSACIPYALGTREYFEYYDRLREKIETVAFSYRLHEYPDFQGKRVLDVGCGNGYVLSRYAQEGATVCGIDITTAGVDLCRKRFENLGLAGDFQVADAEELPFGDSAFDCVCSMGVLHHVPNTEKAVAEIFRVLKPSGRLIVMLYHRHSAQYRFRFPLVSLLTGKPRQQLVNEFDGIGNPKGWVYSRAEVRHLLQQFAALEMFAGYLTGSMMLPRGGRLVPEALLRPFARWWGWNLYAKARKPGCPCE